MAHILVVEDDRDIAELIVHYLKNAGHHAHRLATGTEVMRTCAPTPSTWSCST